MSDGMRDSSGSHWFTRGGNMKHEAPAPPANLNHGTWLVSKAQELFTIAAALESYALSREHQVRNDALEYAAQIADEHWPESGHVHQKEAISCQMSISVAIRKAKTLKEWEPTEHERLVVAKAEQSAWAQAIERAALVPWQTGVDEFDEIADVKNNIRDTIISLQRDPNWLEQREQRVIAKARLLGDELAASIGAYALALARRHDGDSIDDEEISDAIQRCVKAKQAWEREAALERRGDK
jgi:hypothetical protein